MLYGCFPLNLAKITAPRAPTHFRGQRMKSCLEWRVVCEGGSVRTLASPHARAALAFSIDDDALGARALPFSNASPARVLPTFLFHFVRTSTTYISSLSTGQVRPSSITRFHSPTRLRLKSSFQIAAQVHVHQQGRIRGD